ncbi:hypothetical protein ABIE26_002477 [Pedobacter africanus]|uniref:Uncharacterized protein n=1 Tax=Pedobacter africanus TaxID=151894 RepID=A0ACC6KXP4_9SPHI|nr:hypothetical protein [Pedobacter africanus]MDR6784134.1 hypothetical protein [Pedobacter africanus]
MNKQIYIVLGGILLLTGVLVMGYLVLSWLGLKNMGNPTGGRGPDYPYFITTEPLTIKKILVPKGTKLTYEEQFFKKGQQDELLNENKLTKIELPEGKPIDWGGVPVFMIIKFFNPEMQGYSVCADFNRSKDDRKTKFSELWQSCNNDLGVLIENTQDWSFNTKNIRDVSDCGVNFQRYFKENKERQQFLDELYKELKKVDLK